MYNVEASGPGSSKIAHMQAERTLISVMLLYGKIRKKGLASLYHSFPTEPNEGTLHLGEGTWSRPLHILLSASPFEVLIREEKVKIRLGASTVEKKGRKDEEKVEWVGGAWK